MEPQPSRRRTKAEINAEINRHLLRQAGRISFTQLRDLDLDSDAIKRRRNSGGLILDSEPKPHQASAHRGAGGGRPPAQATPLTRRVYRGPGAATGPDGQRWSAVLSAPQGLGYIDHISACQLHGLQDRHGAPIHVVVEGGGWEGPRGVVEHRTRSLPPEDRTRVRGIPTTSIPRALIAAAPDIATEVLHDLLDTAVRLRKYDGEAMVRLLESRQTVPGYRPLVEAVGALDATSGTFLSIFERRTTRLVERSRLIPPPVVNVLIDGFRPDLRWLHTRAIVECDGRDYHRSPAQIIADAKRQEILEGLGYRFLRLRWADVVYDEQRTLARIERFVLDNQAPPVPGR